MDFFVMNFSELFCEKHGEQLFNNICNKIVLENNNNSKEHFSISVSFFLFCAYIYPTFSTFALYNSIVLLVKYLYFILLSNI